jgi:hypothetical protein
MVDPFSPELPDPSCDPGPIGLPPPPPAKPDPEKVQEGVEVIVERDHRPVAVIKTPYRSGRPITEILREARQRNSTVTLDEDFGTDLEEIISRHQREPWNPPSWD